MRRRVVHGRVVYASSPTIDDLAQDRERAWQDSNPRIPSQDTRNILIMIGKLASILIEYEHSTGVQAFLGSLAHLSTEGDEE